MTPGSLSGRVREVYQEGLRIVPHPHLRRGKDERSLAHPAVRQHAHHPRAARRLQHHARDLAQGGGARRPAVRALRRGVSARCDRGADRAGREGDARADCRYSGRDVPRGRLPRQRRPRCEPASRPARPHRRGRPPRRRFHRLVAPVQGTDQRGAGDGVQRGGKHREVLPGFGDTGQPRLVQSDRDRESARQLPRRDAARPVRRDGRVPGADVRSRRLRPRPGASRGSGSAI